MTFTYSVGTVYPTDCTLLLHKHTSGITETKEYLIESVAWNIICHYLSFPDMSDEYILSLVWNNMDEDMKEDDFCCCGGE